MNYQCNAGYEQQATRPGFTLAEVLIVVSILGILAAVVIPSMKGHIQKAKESAAKENLRILRTAIERYAIEHNGIPPGYPNGNTSEIPTWPYLFAQLLKATNANSQHNEIGTAGFPLGPYLKEFPGNPFNNSKTVKMIPNEQEMPNEATGTFGWIYKPSTKELRLDWPGLDSEETNYYSY